MAERGELVNTQHRCLCWVLRAVFDSIYKDMMIMSWTLIFWKAEEKTAEMERKGDE